MEFYIEFFKTLSVEFFGIIIFIWILMALASLFLTMVIYPIQSLKNNIKENIQSWARNHIAQQTYEDECYAKNQAIIEATIEHHKRGGKTPLMTQQPIRKKCKITKLPTERRKKI